jgi:hypothetical protein
MRAEYQTARELAEQCFSLAQRVQAPALLLEAHFALGVSVLWLGEVVSARAHLEQGIALYNSQEHRAPAFRAGIDLAVWCLSHVAQALWLLGYPDQALRRNYEALTIAQEGIVNLTKKLGETVKIVGTISDQLTKASGGSCVNDDP